MPSSSLQKYIPDYARLIDSTGILEHVCEALQPQIDEAQNLIDFRQYIFDPEVAPPQWLPYIGQLFGLGLIDNHWLGVGLNPQWPAAQMRRVILGQPEYLRRKGQEWGIREAVLLWLQFESAHDRQKLKIIQPFGDRSVDTPPNWWGYDTEYDANLNLEWIDQQRLGAGEYARTWQDTESFLLSAEFDDTSLYDGDWWSDGSLELNRTPIEVMPGSALAAESPWMSFDLTPNEWLAVVPGIQELNLQAWNTHAHPTVFAWLKSCGLPANTETCYDQSQRTESPILLKPKDDLIPYTETTYYEYDGFQYNDWWYVAPANYRSINSTTTYETFFIEGDGHSFADVWPNAQGWELEQEGWYFAYGDNQPSTITTATTESWPIHTEASGDIIIGYETKLIGYEPNGEQNQEFELVKGFVFEVNPLLLPVPQVDAADLPLPEIDSINLPMGLADRYVISWTSEDELLQVPPLNVHCFGNIWHEGDEYFYPGNIGNPGSLTQVPIYQSVIFPNLIPYSTPIITDIIVEREIIPITQFDVSDVYPILKEVSIGNNWKLLIETDFGIVVVETVSLFWHCCCDDNELSDRSQSIDIFTGRTNLYIEFLWSTGRECKIYSYTLLMNDRHVRTVTVPTPLPLPPWVNAGFKFDLPFRFETGAKTLDDHAEILRYLEVLKTRLAMLKTLTPINVVPVPNTFQFPLFPFIPETLMDCCDTPPISAQFAKLDDQFAKLFAQLGTLPTDADLAALESRVQPNVPSIAALVLNEIRDDLPTGGFNELITVRAPVDGVFELNQAAQVTTTTFEFSTGIGSRDFAIGQIRFLQPNSTEAELQRPEVIVFGTDSIRLVFWGERIDDSSFQVWIYEGQGSNIVNSIAPIGGVVSNFNGIQKTVFMFSAAIGSRNFAVSQIRSVSVADEIELERPQVEITGVDTVQLTFWGQNIADGSFEVWIIRGSDAL